MAMAVSLPAQGDKCQPRGPWTHQPAIPAIPTVHSVPTVTPGDGRFWRYWSSAC
jgi:hypothetical protein